MQTLNLELSTGAVTGSLPLSLTPLQDTTVELAINSSGSPVNPADVRAVQLIFFVSGQAIFSAPVSRVGSQWLASIDGSQLERFRALTITATIVWTGPGASSTPAFFVDVPAEQGRMFAGRDNHTVDFYYSQAAVASRASSGSLSSQAAVASKAADATRASVASVAGRLSRASVSSRAGDALEASQGSQAEIASRASRASMASQGTGSSVGAVASLGSVGSHSAYASVSRFAGFVSALVEAGSGGVTEADRPSLLGLSADLFRVRKDGANYELLWNAYYDSGSSSYKAVEGSGSAEAFRFRFGNDGTTAKLIAFDAASGLSAEGVITWADAPLSVGALLMSGDLNMGTSTRSISAGELLLKQNTTTKAKIASYGLLLYDNLLANASSYDIGGYNPSVYRFRYGFFKGLEVTNDGSGASSYADSTRYASADVAGDGLAVPFAWDEQKYARELGEIVLSATINHDDTDWHNLVGVSGIPGHEGFYVPTDTVCAFDILIAGINSGASIAVAYRIEGLCVNDGGTLSIKGTPTKTVINESDDTDLDVQVASIANAYVPELKELAVQVSDSSGDAGQIKWRAKGRLNMIQHT